MSSASGKQKVSSLDEVRADTPLHSVNSQDKLYTADSTEQVSGESMAETTGLIATLRKTWRVATQGTVVSSIFILLTTCVGAGTLSLPYGFTQGGLVFSSIVFFVIMVMSIHIGSMLFAGKRYAAEVYPEKEVWGYADLAEVTFGIVGKIAVLLTIAILLFLALIAYMIYARDQYFSLVKEDVILNYPHDNHLMLAARVALFIMLVTSYPVLLHPTRDSINSVIFLVKELVSKRLGKRRLNSTVNTEEVKLLKEDADLAEVKAEDTKKQQIPTLIWFCETFIIFACSFLPASFIPNVGLVWNFVGSIGGVLVLYIYPAACYLKLRIARYKLRSREQGITVLSQYNAAAVLKELIAWSILIAGLLLLVVENYQAIDGVVNMSHEPSGQCIQLVCTNANGSSRTNASYWYY